MPDHSATERWPLVTDAPGSGAAGHGTAGHGTAGLGTAGLGTAGLGTAGLGTAGHGAAGHGGTGHGSAGGGDSLPDLSGGPRPQEIRLGRQIRQLRHEQGLTLVALAGMTSLSHPFLSQLERGLARPSMTSLERIAQALQSSQSELMATATDDVLAAPGPPFTLVRSEEGTKFPAPGGSARLLVGGTARFHPMIYVGDNSEFEEYYQHAEDEFVHIIDGAIEIDLGDSGLLGLGIGDSLYYRGGTPHRWRSAHRTAYRLLAVKEIAGQSLSTAHG